MDAPTEFQEAFPTPRPTLPTREERKAKREARRVRQRAENIGRAAKMHLARLEWEEANKMSAAHEDSCPIVNVGCSGWFYWHWRDTFYPSALPTSKWFDHYLKHFGTVELNAPFYSWPTVAAVRTWVRQIGRRRFNYTVKVSELITHVKRFSGTKTLIKDFGLIAHLLGKAMGCFLFQLPPSFQFSEARLHRIVSQLNPACRNVVEFRHRSWWNETVYAAFRQSGTIFCSCSGPRLPDELVKTANDVYIRFHGTKTWYRHDYSTAELSTWAERIKKSGAEHVWAYFNNDRNGFSIKNARRLRQLLTQYSI